MNSPDFQEYERLIVHLHRLIRAGQGDSAAANHLREAMEIPERNLTRFEIRRLNGLSADLYMIAGEELPDPNLVRNPPHALEENLLDAYRRLDWSELLRLLRAGPSSLPAEQVAYIRFRAYDAMGMNWAALEFIDYAARCNAANANYPALAMNSLIRLEQFGEALRRSDAYLCDPRTPGRLAIMAANAAYHCLADEGISGKSRADLQLAAVRLTEHLPREAAPNVRFAGYVVLALIQRELGSGEFHDALRTASDMVIDDAQLILARGILQASLLENANGVSTNDLRKLAAFVTDRLTAAA